MDNQGSEADTNATRPLYNPQPEFQPPGYYDIQHGTSPTQQPGGFGHPSFPVQHQPSKQSTSQQFPAGVVQGEPREWSSGLCDCCADMNICLLGTISYVQGIPLLELQLSAHADECFCVGWCWVCAIAMRTKIRLQHNIKGSIFEDFCTILCCRPCALCQMQRELNLHPILRI